MIQLSFLYRTIFILSIFYFIIFFETMFFNRDDYLELLFSFIPMYFSSFIHLFLYIFCFLFGQNIPFSNAKVVFLILFFFNFSIGFNF